MDQKQTNARVIDQFRAGGEIEGMHRDRLLLLTTVGRSSGQQRTAPMMFHRQSDGLYVVASNNGARTDPGWYRNLEADSHVIVEIGNERFPASASTLEGDERERVWEAILAEAPFFAQHQAAIDRQIPVVRLEREPERA